MEKGSAHDDIPRQDTLVLIGIKPLKHEALGQIEQLYPGSTWTKSVIRDDIWFKYSAQLLHRTSNSLF